MAAVSIASGGWIAISEADFGPQGAEAVRLQIRSEIPSEIEIIPDDPEGEPVAVLTVPACETDTEINGKLELPLTGTHNLYFRFSESGITMLEWQFQSERQ